jgi:multiple sugar transport system ATP-binding protein
MNELELSNVVKCYGVHTPVDGISMTVRDGELAVVVGPSGCGKTTTLRLIAGLEEVSEGTIRLGREIVNHMPPRKRDVAVIFQNYSLYQHLSVSDNLGFGLKVRRTPKAQIKAKVEAIAEILHIRHLLKRNAAKLSGGEKQRVAIGRALVRNPRLFLMDEPLSNLDAKLRIEMRAEIKKIHREFKTTSLYVTHDQAEAMSLADRLIVMNHGRIIQEGKPLEVFQRPNHIFVAQFLGSPTMNLIPGELDSNNGHLHFRAETISLPIPGARSRQFDSDQVFLGLRSGDIDLASAQNENTFVSGRVQVVESLGEETLIWLECGPHEIRVKSHKPMRIEPGEICHLAARPGALRFFDRNSGWAFADLDGEPYAQSPSPADF